MPRNAEKSAVFLEGPTLHTGGVAGSSPASPTIKINGLSGVDTPERGGSFAQLLRDVLYMGGW